MGTVVVDGKDYQVTSLALRRGMLLITARGPVPRRRVVRGVVTVFGEDGQGVGQGWLVDLPGRGDVAGDWVTIRLPLQLATIEPVAGPSPLGPGDWPQGG